MHLYSRLDGLLIARVADRVIKGATDARYVLAERLSEVQVPNQSIPAKTSAAIARRRRAANRFPPQETESQKIAVISVQLNGIEPSASSMPFLGLSNSSRYLRCRIVSRCGETSAVSQPAFETIV